MFFNSSSSTNASNGIFNDVGGNQNSVYYISNNYGPTIQLSVFAASVQSPCHLPRKRSTNQSSDSSTGNIVTLNHSSVAVIIGATIGHIVQITDLMISRGVPSSSHLVPELKLLQQTLILYELAIEAYTDSPLCRGLANTITPAVERCSVVLKEIRDKISSTSLKFIGITDMCRSVWWNGWDENELMSLKRMVSGVRAPLSDMLLALNSVSWVELGNELCTSHVSLEQFHTLLSKRLPFLGCIQLHSVQVVDHLGRIVPVPTQFCSSWEEFDYIINGYCRKKPGSRFVERGEYEVMRTSDNQIINRSEFSVESGMTLEMTIIMRQSTAKRNNKCPRCNHLNLNVTGDDGWIECRGCPAQFQVSVDDNDKESSKQRSERDSREDGGRLEESEESGDDHDQEIISPASRPEGIPSTRPRANRAHPKNIQLQQPEEDDGKRYFRRMQIIYNITPGPGVSIMTATSHWLQKDPKSGRPFYPQTNRPTVPTVEKITVDLSLLDITEHIQKDSRYKFAIGSGASGDVYRAIYNVANPETKEPYSLNVVVKIIRGTLDENEMMQRRFNRELACWFGLKHPNVAELLGIAYILPGKPPGLVSKWVQRHDFLKFIGSHPDLKREKAKEIACGLQYLHANGVVHGNLKADNVIVSDRKEAQLNDFSCARIQDVDGFTSLDRVPGNIRFTAPELMPMDDDDYDSLILPTPASDIFSLGMLLLQLFHCPDDDAQRRLPYNHVRVVSYYDVQLARRIHAGDRPIRERYNYMENQHWAIICKCWAGEPEKRPTIAVVHNSL